ncbi:M16 family metallopeptidase [Bacteroidota bacterium]
MNCKIWKYLSGLLIVLMFLATGSHANAQFNPVKFYKDSLDNGLQVIYCQDKSAPIVATIMHYRVGSKDEVSTQTGYAHFFEHLMFEATEDIPRSSIDKYVQEAGGNLNASTSFDQTVYFFKLPANQLKLALWIESERMRKLKVDKDGVETQRGVVLEEIKQRTTNQPYGTLLQKTMENLFGGTSYGWSVLGYEKNIAAATIEQFRSFYNKFYQPNNATLVVAGDFDAPETRKLINEYFGAYDRGPEPKRSAINLPPLNKGYREVIDDDKVKLPGVFISYRGPAKNDSNFYAASLLTDILASGESSRLYQRLVNEEQIAVNASVMPMTLQYAGVLMLIGIASPGKNIEDVEEIIHEEIDKIIENGVTEEELEKAKNIAEAEFVSDKKNVLSKARALAQYNSYYSDPGLINTELERYLEVTIDDIKRVAKQYYGTDNNVTLVYMPKEK